MTFDRLYKLISESANVDDEYYLELAKEPEKNKDILQRMVDEAARAAVTPTIDPRYSDINLFREYWNSKGVRNMTDISYSGTQYEHIRPLEIEVKKQDRGKGLGTAFMEDLIRFADLNGMQVRINPSIKLGATSRTRLDKFYKRFGFVENKPGKNKDYTISERFYRNPISKNRTLKSADPVTYDDEGNVIPLSQRFDSSKDDIRY